jgi:hypothetical protein
MLFIRLAFNVLAMALILRQLLPLGITREFDALDSP